MVFKVKISEKLAGTQSIVLDICHVEFHPKPKNKSGNTGKISCTSSREV
jgi:hypothetical protein